MRDLIDYAVAREVINLMQERFNKKTELPTGKAAATLAQALVSLIMSEDLKDTARRLDHMHTLMNDLFVNGWHVPKEVEITQ